MRIHIIVAAATLLASTSLVSADDSTYHIPDQYRVATGPHGGISPSTLKQGAKTAKTESAVEHPADALDGAFYAEVFPVYQSGDPSNNVSYLRLGNANSAPTTFSLVVLGSPSGAQYGAGDIVVPANASLQLPFTPAGGSGDITTTLSVQPLANNDTLYAIYITNPDTNTTFQNVIFSGVTGFFEDFTICPPGASLEGATFVTNVHTSLLGNAGYPSSVFIHNLLNVNAEYTVTVYDARTGAVVGTIPSVTANANSTYVIPFATFQQQINFTPNANQQHVNLQFYASQAFAQILVPPDPGQPATNPTTITDIGGIFGSEVIDTHVNGAYLNLSNKCSINR